MENDTTTAVPDEPTGADEALPVETPDTTSADVQTVDEPSEPSTDADTPSAPVVDDKLKKFAENQGIELDSPGAIKAAQIALKSQSEATRNHQKSQELERASNITNDQVPVDAPPEVRENVRIRNLELKYEISNWKNQNQDKLALESEMVNILSDPVKKQLVQEGILSLDDIHSLAKANAPDNSAEVKSQAKKDALSNLAQNMKAAVPTGHATNSTPPAKKDFKELSIAEMEAKLGFVRR